MTRMTLLMIGACITSTQAAYAPSAPIQWMSRVVMPQRSAGPFRDSTSPQLLLIKDPPSKISRDKVPHFTLNSDSSITLEGTDTCIEAASVRSGSAARLSRCNGDPAQKWNWIPDSHGGSHIRLKDTDKCLDASIEGGFNGAPIVLWECKSKSTEAWKFEEVVLKQGPYLVINLITLAGVAALSLGALLWQYVGPFKLVPISGGATSNLDEGGVSLSSPVAVQSTASLGSASQRHGDVVMSDGNGCGLRAAVRPRASVKMVWHVFPADGAGGVLKTVYWVERGTSQALGRYDMVEAEGQKMHIDPEQCIVQAADDGSCIYAYARGTNPTGWRTSPYEPWNTMQPGESVVLGNDHQLSLDCYDPEAAVFKFEREKPKPGMIGYEPPAGFGQLPPGWISGVDQNSGQTYYYNQQTGQSQWDPPM